MGVASNIQVPFVGVEFDSSRAFQGPATLRYKVLLVGQKIAAGTLAKEQVTQVFSADKVAEYAGLGSQAHLMAKKYFLNNKTTDTYICLLEDDGGATAATHTYTITGTATKSGEIQIYIAGRRISTAVAVGDTATTVGAALNTAIGNISDLPVTASHLTGVITLTAKNKGTIGNELDVRDIYNDSDVIPAGLTVTIAAGTTGATDPSVANVITAMGNTWFNVIVAPYTDTSNLDLFEAELADRAGPIRQIDGMLYVSKKDTTTNLVSFATNASRNSQYVSVIDSYKFPNLSYEIAAAVAGQVATSAQSDPGKGLRGYLLQGINTQVSSDEKPLTELNTLFTNGVCTVVNQAGGVRTYGMVTMYLKNSTGALDPAYQLQYVVFLLMLLRYQFRQRILTKYPNARLANDATRIKPGIQVITPAIGKAEAVSLALEWEANGYIENIEQFKSEVICRRSTTNVNRLEWIFSPDLINQLLVGSADLQFILEA